MQNYQDYVGQWGIDDVQDPFSHLIRERLSSRTKQSHDPNLSTQQNTRSEELEDLEKSTCPYEKFLEEGELDDASHFIDTAAIGDMTQVVEGLKESDGFLGHLSGWMNNSLTGRPVLFDNSFRDTTDETRLVKLQIKEFKHISDQFQKLAKCMEATCAVAERRWEAAQIRIGLASLPNELLSNILSLASTVHETNPSSSRATFCAAVSFRNSFRSAVDFSHVCDRFRRTALQTPELWNKISDDMNQHMVQLCLVRSGALPLEVSLTSFPNRGKFSEFYAPVHFTRFAMLTSNQWRSLEVSSSTVTGFSHPGISLKNLDLQSLTNLKITSSHDRRHFKSESGVLQGWNTPNLHSMTIDQFIPPSFQHSVNLRCLRIALRGFSGRESKLNAQAFRDFLATCTSLTDLHIHVGSARFVDIPEIPFRASLPNVEVVSFDIQSCSPATVRALLDQVRFPAASKVILVLGLLVVPDMSQGFLSSNMEPFFQDEVTFPAATTLNLSVKCINSEMRYSTVLSGKISIPFMLLGNIRHLTLTIAGFSMAHPSKDGIPPLRSLKLQDCDCIDPLWLFAVVEKLEQQGNLGELEEISIIGCGARLQDLELKCRAITQGTVLEYLREKVLSTYTVEYRPERHERRRNSPSDHWGYLDRFNGQTDSQEPPVLRAAMVRDWINEIQGF
ncbi:hypothetical protein SCHPADRAFT_94984 [Schizopora paradoxa]|uniref:Uncharacterized protein n=1 Tax=Schizopora paradoxa TaxID=27342 RepID=A0A0H2S4X0_9AGAM|nr:hypothetical protein SCHPADRAFT_94984 [Schizopora paradoxa]